MTNFSFSTIKNFDTHIRQSIRGYDSLVDDIIDLSAYFISDDSKVIDLGCSEGTVLKNISDNTYNNVQYLGVEIEDNFFNKLKEMEDDNIQFVQKDISHLPSEFYDNSSLIISLFTLQFIPLKHRLNILKRVYDGLNAGGCLIVTEKIFFDDSKVESAMSSLYYDYKRKHFSAEDILNKEKDLRYLMKPMFRRELDDMLRAAGFSYTENFWQSYNFTGILCVK